MVGPAPLAHPVEQVEVAIEVGGAVLGAVAQGGVFRPLDSALVGGELAHQAAQQGGFTHPVLADNRQPGARLNHDAALLEQRYTIEAVAQVLQGHRLAVQLLFLLEADIGAHPAGGLDVIEGDLGDLLGPGGRLLGLGGVGGEAADELLQLGDLRAFLGVLRVQFLPRLGGGGHEIVVVAGVDPQLAVVDVGHVGTDRVEEVAVVGNDDHGGLAGVEHPFQPANGIDIQVVGGLVQQQDVGVGKQGLGQQHPQLPARRHLAHGAEMQFPGDTGTQQDLTRPALGGIAVHFREQGLELGDFHAVVLGHLGQRVNTVPLLLDLPQLPVAHDHGVHHREFLERELVLVQAANTLVGRNGDIARRGHKTAVEDFHEGGFAAAIGADQAVAIAVAELDRDIFKQRLGTELHGDIGGRDHGVFLVA